MLVAALIVVLTILMAGYLPVPAHSDFWTYYPGDGASAVLLVLLVLLLIGRP
jgi:hypothetical protein